MDKRDGIWYYKYVGPLQGAALLFFYSALLSDEIGGLLFLLGGKAELRLTQGDGFH